MSDVTILSNDAERLVYEGGVVNRDDTRALGPPRDRGPFDTPFTAEVRALNEVHAPPSESGGRIFVQAQVGTVTVTDVHHADDCAVPGMLADGPDSVSHCHPEARADMWHWTVEPTETQRGGRRG